MFKTNRLSNQHIYFIFCNRVWLDLRGQHELEWLCTVRHVCVRNCNLDSNSCHWIGAFSDHFAEKAQIRTIFGPLSKMVRIWTKGPNFGPCGGSGSRILFQKITSANLALKGLSSTHSEVLHPLVPCILGKSCFWSSTTKNWSP